MLSCKENETDECFKRISKRNRECEKGISKNYLNLIVNKTNALFLNWTGPKIKLETNSLFAKDCHSDYTKLISDQINLFTNSTK